MNPVSGANVSKFITKMTKADALAPVIALEATVTLGRTFQAYKRGGWDEARERGIEETTGAIVWLYGVNVLNKLGDKILGKMLGPKGKNFDVGTDKILRTPFDNYMKKGAPKGISSKHVALLKGFKVLSSVVLADMFIGLVVPKVNQNITKLMQGKKLEQEQAKAKYAKKFNTNVGENPSFKGGFSAINTFTNAIENSNTGKLLSTDAGLISGRMYSARNKDERREIAIRDIGSIYFYMWAQGHVRNVLNYIQTGKSERLNPTTATSLDKHLQDFLAKNGGEMTVEEFKSAVLGKKASEIKLPENIKFETAELSSISKFLDKFSSTKTEPLQVVRVKDVENFFTDSEVLKRIRKMSKLQPERMGEAVITKAQLIDAVNIAEINNPTFLNQIFTDFTGGKSNNKYKYVPEDSLRNLKSQMEDYVELLCKDAKDGKITKNVIEKAKNKNLKYNGINFAISFAFAATFLSTLIPKIQYWVTKQKTGKEGFPGMYEYEQKQSA